VEQAKQTVLIVNNLSCERDDRLLFSGLSFKLYPGQVMLLEGSNGSGKTSLLRLLCGFREPDAGEINWCGFPLTESSYFADMAYVGHTDGIKKELSVLENLQFALALSTPGHYDIQQALQKVQLAGYDDNSVQTLSAGQSAVFP
jgi:heme exporter protein A